MEKQIRCEIRNGKVVYPDYPTQLKDVPVDFPFTMLNYTGTYIRPIIYDTEMKKLELDGYYLWILEKESSYIFRMSTIKPCRLLTPDLHFEGMSEGMFYTINGLGEGLL